MADGFYNADSQQRSVDGMKPWQWLRARFSETLIASHPTSPHCVRGFSETLLGLGKVSELSLRSALQRY
jgi:hypothetical protein